LRLNKKISQKSVFLNFKKQQEIFIRNMRNNYWASGADPMKSRSQRARDKKKKIARSNRSQRLKRRLGKIGDYKVKKQQQGHMTALMESYALRRQKERLEEKKKKQNEQEAVADVNGFADGGKRGRNLQGAAKRKQHQKQVRQSKN
jgi:hypothetical protein